MKRITVLLTALAVGGCHFPAPKSRTVIAITDSIALAGVDSARVSVQFGAGKLAVAAGSERLLDAGFRYNIPDWKPKVEYELNAGLGRLSVTQPSTVVGFAWPSDVTYEWNLALSDRVPLELAVNLGVGKAELDLRGLRITRLNIEAGVGEGRIDLSGPRPVDLVGSIQAGVGKLAIILPAGLPVEVKVAGGIGEVRARGFERDGETVRHGGPGPRIRLKVEGGVGDVELQLAGTEAR